MNALLTAADLQMQAPSPHSNRVTCWLLRSALEEAIESLLVAKGLHLGEQASTRARLTCLEVAYAGTVTASRAQYTWSRLSEACHHHAYELSPTYSETLHLRDLVRSLTTSV